MTRGANTDTMCVCGLPACRITSAAAVLPPSETEHVVIAIAVGPRSTFSSDILFFCVFLIPRPFSTTWFVGSIWWTPLQSVDGGGGRVGGAGLKRAAVSVQRSPHQSTPDQSSQQASHHKKHCGGCSDSQDGVPTYLTLLGRGGGERQEDSGVTTHGAGWRPSSRKVF